MQIIVIGKRGDFRGITVSKYLGYFFAAVSISVVTALIVLGSAYLSIKPSTVQ